MPARFPVAPLLVIVVLVLAAASCDGDRPRAPQRDVILITIDTLRADRLGLHGYSRSTTPEIDRWFGDGAIFERAYSSEAATSPSVATILSGLYPQEHRVRLFYQLLPEEVPLVSDLLRPAYQTAAFVSNMVLTDEAIGMAGRFDHYDDFVESRESTRNIYERDARATTDAVLEWLEHERDGRPLFLWVHYIDPHGPYRPPSEWTIPFEGGEPRPLEHDRIPDHVREPGILDGNEYVRRYDGEIAWTDQQVSRLLAGYARLRPIDDALVVLTADHGESMMDHERWFTHGYHVYEEIVRVPLLVRGPGVEPGRFRVPVSSIDIAPTVLAFAGVAPPEGRSTAGADLRWGSRLDARRMVYSEASFKSQQRRSVVQGDRKWVVTVEKKGRRILEPHSYDLGADPHELAPQPVEGPPPDAMRALLELVRSDPDPAGVPKEWEKGIQIEAPKVAPRVSEEELERLRGLGYAE
jgi:arylsulfatase